MSDRSTNSERQRARPLAPRGWRVAGLGACFVVLLGGLQGDTWACNIPVFRYALERWQPDEAKVVVFHRGPLSMMQTEQLSKLERAVATDSPASGHANAALTTVDLEIDAASAQAALWSRLAASRSAQLPQVVVRTPVGPGRHVNHWQGSLAEAVSADLFDSPVRRRLRRRLLDGHSVVWLVVQSDNAAKTQRVTSRLEQQLARLPQQIQLPEGIGLPGSELYADVPLVLKFSVLTIDPADPRERFLVQLLTGLRQQAFDAGEPLLVPVFGRGRALEVIPGEDLQGPLAGDLTRFLCGACSCQVKEQNPGFDLLMTVDWDHELFGDSEQRPPKQAGSRAANAPVLVPIPPGR